MKTQISIIITLQVEGQHRWLNCPILEVAFLKSFHRHIFHIECEKVVEHNDRDIEIIRFKREVEDYFKRIYFDPTLNMCNFKEMSCEDICQDLMDIYDLESCTIKEDGENGAKIQRIHGK